MVLEIVVTTINNTIPIVINLIVIINTCYYYDLRVTIINCWPCYYYCNCTAAAHTANTNTKEHINCSSCTCSNSSNAITTRHLFLAPHDHLAPSDGDSGFFGSLGAHRGSIWTYFSCNAAMGCTRRRCTQKRPNVPSAHVYTHFVIT